MVASTAVTASVEVVVVVVVEREEEGVWLLRALVSGDHVLEVEVAAAAAVDAADDAAAVAAAAAATARISRGSAACRFLRGIGLTC